MNFIKNIIQKFELKWSDLLLAIGFLFSSVFYAFSWQFMVNSNPNNLFLKPWMIIISFIIVFSCWGGYLFLEHRANNLPKPYISGLFFFVAIWSVMSILIQPSQVIEEVVMRVVNDTNSVTYPGHSVGDIITITLQLSPVHKMFFAMAAFVIVEVFYITFFVLPKRFKNLNFLILVGCVTFAFLFVMIGYSYVTEWDHYIPFLKALFGDGTIEDVYENAVCSFIVHRVPYGACMMMGLTFTIVVHSIHQKWYWYLLTAFFYANMIFSYCKTALIISALIVVAYVVFRLIYTYKEYRKRNKILIISLGSLFGLFILLVGVSYISKGAILSPIYKMITSVTGTNTIDTRSYIWDNEYQLLRNGWWIIGRGFGTFNEVLYVMNIVNGDPVAPSHSSYNAMLGYGGIVYLLGFIAIIVYAAYMVIKCYKKDPARTFGFAVCVAGYLLYAFTEGVHHLLLTFVIPICFLNQILNGNENKQ